MIIFAQKKYTMNEIIKQDFNQVYSIIDLHRKRAFQEKILQSKLHSLLLSEIVIFVFLTKKYLARFQNIRYLCAECSKLLKRQYF